MIFLGSPEARTSRSRVFLATRYMRSDAFSAIIVQVFISPGEAFSTLAKGMGKPGLRLVGGEKLRPVPAWLSRHPIYWTYSHKNLAAMESGS